MSAVADEIWEIVRENSLQIGLLRESQEAFKQSQKETERIIDKIQRETSAEFKEIQREIKKVNDATNTNIGRLTNRLGEFIQESVRPAAVKLFRERGIDVHEVHQNISAKRDGEGLEIDLLVVNNNDVVIIECKSHLGVDDVNEHLERLEKAKRLLPDHKNKQIFGAVAAMVIPANVASYAIRKGLYVIGQNGEQLELQNDASFKAKVW